MAASSTTSWAVHNAACRWWGHPLPPDLPRTQEKLTRPQPSMGFRLQLECAKNTTWVIFVGAMCLLLYMRYLRVRECAHKHTVSPTSCPEPYLAGYLDMRHIQIFFGGVGCGFGVCGSSQRYFISLRAWGGRLFFRLPPLPPRPLRLPDTGSSIPRRPASGQGTAPPTAAKKTRRHFQILTSCGYQLGVSANT